MSEVLPCGEPRAHRWDAPGAQGTRPGTQYKRVTPRHMTMRTFSLPFSSGIKVTTSANRPLVQLFDFSGCIQPHGRRSCPSPDSPTRVRPFPDFESVWGDYERRWSGMLTHFLAGRTFEPDQIVVMSAAFADTCKALGLSEADHPLLPLVARHVMGLGQRGVKTRAVIYLLTLEEFRPYRQ